jgi:N-acetyl-anhydromuramyl-L-alanine amidase AmpD
LDINRSLRLPDNEFFHDVVKKDLIVLHHTVGGSAESTFDWWKTDPKRIGTAFLVERDGTIFEVFPPEAWASHINRVVLGVQVRDMEKRSIGIEICSEGPLLERGGGNFYCFDRVSERTRYEGKVYRHPEVWRDRQCFAAYTPRQIESVVELVGALSATFSIPLIKPTIPDTSNLASDYIGIAGHADFRPDKTDVHPGFPWELIGASV